MQPDKREPSLHIQDRMTGKTTDLLVKAREAAKYKPVIFVSFNTHGAQYAMADYLMMFRNDGIEGRVSRLNYTVRFEGYHEVRFMGFELFCRGWEKLAPADTVIFIDELKMGLKLACRGQLREVVW